MEGMWLKSSLIECIGTTKNISSKGLIPFEKNWLLNENIFLWLAGSKVMKASTFNTRRPAAKNYRLSNWDNKEKVSLRKVDDELSCIELLNIVPTSEDGEGSLQ
jgi:hypothetical protein